MILVCNITGLKVSSSPCFDSLVYKEKIIHPFFYVSLSSVAEEVRKREKLFSEGKEKEKIYSPEECLLLAFYPFAFLGKVKLENQGGIPSEVVLSGEYKLYTAALIATRIITSLSALTEKQISTIKNDLPILVPSELNIKTLISFLEDLENAIYFTRVSLSEKGKLEIKVNSKALTKDSTFIKSYMDMISSEEHLVTLMDVAEIYKELFPLGEESYKWILESGISSPEKLATKEWVEKLNTIQSNLVEVLDFNGKDAVRTTALIKYFNKILENVNSAHALMNKNTYGLENLSSTTTYSKKGMNVTILSLESVEDLDLEVSMDSKKVSSTGNSLSNKNNQGAESETSMRLRAALAKLAARNANKGEA